MAVILCFQKDFVIQKYKQAAALRYNLNSVIGDWLDHLSSLIVSLECKLNQYVLHAFGWTR